MRRNQSHILLNRRNRIYHLLWHVAHSENYLLHADFRERTKLVEQDRSDEKQERFLTDCRTPPMASAS